MKWLLIFCFLFLPTYLIADDYKFDETVTLPLDEKTWKLGFEKNTEKGSSTKRYFLQSETKDKWTKIVNIQFRDKALVKGESALQTMTHEIEKSPLAKTRVLKSKKNDITYIRTFPTGEEEIVRMIITSKGVHRIAYIEKGHIDEKEEEEWLERLSKAEVGKPQKSDVKEDKKEKKDDSKKKAKDKA